MKNDRALPASWVPAKLSDIADVNPKADKSEIADDLEVSFVPMPAVEELSGRIDLSTYRRFSEVKKGYTAFLEGDVLFAKITPCMENGKMAVVPELKNGYGFGSTEFHVLRPCQGIDAKYLYHFVSSQRFRADAEHNMTGAVGQRRVPTQYVSEQCIPIAPSKEQRRIVAKIEELFPELDKGIEALTNAREQLKAFRQSILKHAFEGKLTAEWRLRNPSRVRQVSELLEQIGSYKGFQVVGLSEPEGMPDVPDTWTYIRAEDICDFITKGTTPKKDLLFDREGDIPFIKVYNLTFSGALDFSVAPTFTNRETHERFLARSKVYPNDVLMNIVGPPLGKVSIVPSLFPEWNINQAIAIFRTSFLRPKLLAAYLAYAGTQRALALKAKATAGQFNLTLEICRDIPIPLFDVDEQEVLEERLDQELFKTASLDKDVEAELARCEALRQSILKEAFSGNLVAQGPKDEPASVLLERIRAQREASEATTSRRNSKNGMNARKKATTA